MTQQVCRALDSENGVEKNWVWHEHFSLILCYVHFSRTMGGYFHTKLD